MGNVGCAGSGNYESLCAGRGLAVFTPPNSENVTYCFDYGKDSVIQFCGETRASSDNGFQIESPASETSAPKWHTVKEYAQSSDQAASGKPSPSPNPTQLRLCLSGRILVNLPDAPICGTSPAGVCVFRLCTRGNPVYESVRTMSFTHTAQVVTSGVFFSLSIAVSGSAIYLCPRILLVLESGDEVVLVEDRLGPLQAPQSFYTDFAIVDDGGRNVQMDLIFRQSVEAIKAGDAPSTSRAGPPGRGGMRTLRTCLQEYVALNNQVQPASIALGYSSLASHLPSATVYLQHFVISEGKVKDERGVPEPQPFDVWKEAAHMPEKETSSKILFEGEDARIASMAIDVPEAPVKHPQLQQLKQKTSPSSSPGGTEQSVADFWYHIHYGEDDDDGDSAPELGGVDHSAQIRGEFWLTKRTVEKQNVYFHCSSTLAQALTMCIIFRFSCPDDYVSLIDGPRGSRVLRDAHIPTNGLVLGIERDPRHGALMRMFLEHRNEILEDMVVCECRPADLGRCVVHQEVYDGGSTIIYRVVLLHGDGSRQSAVLQLSTEQLEENANLDTARGGGQYAIGGDPSSRFPIAPNSVRDNLLPNNHIFVYTGTAYDGEDDSDNDAADSVGDGAMSFKSNSVGDAAGMMSATNSNGAEIFSSPAQNCREVTSHMSDGTAEDWCSIGAVSDSENEKEPVVGESSLPKGAISPHKSDKVRWRRPLIESVVILERLEDPPFRCFPTSLS